MSNQEDEPKIIIDSDWKQEAAAEKERLDAETKDAGHAREMPEASFAEIINLLVMQAVVSMGGYQGPGGESLPPDLRAAKHFIDLLDILQTKTEGNLDPEEKTAINAVVHELRMRYVEVTSAAPPTAPPPASPPSP